MSHIYRIRVSEFTCRSSCEPSSSRDSSSCTLRAFESVAELLPFEHGGKAVGNWHDSILHSVMRGTRRPICVLIVLVGGTTFKPSALPPGARWISIFPNKLGFARLLPRPVPRPAPRRVAMHVCPIFATSALIFANEPAEMATRTVQSKRSPRWTTLHYGSRTPKQDGPGDPGRPPLPPPSRRAVGLLSEIASEKSTHMVL